MACATGGVWIGVDKRRSALQRRVEEASALLGRRCMVAADYRRYLARDLIDGFFFSLRLVQRLVLSLSLNLPGVRQILLLLNVGGNCGLLGLPFGLSL